MYKPSIYICIESNFTEASLKGSSAFFIKCSKVVNKILPKNYPAIFARDMQELIAELQDFYQWRNN